MRTRMERTNRKLVKKTKQGSFREKFQKTDRKKANTR